MKIHILCNDGSPLGVTEKTLHGEDGRLGVGGAELGLLTMCRAWQYYGNEVVLYNDPREGGASSFEQRTISQFDPYEDRDVVIIFRSPNTHYETESMKGLKVWWSCDSYTINDFQAYAPRVDRIVTISPYHSKYFKDMYGIHNSIPIDIPVRTWEYKDDVPKKMKQCIFTSIPDRGLMELHAIWPLIQSQVPDANLVITSDWRLWSDWATDEPVRRFRLAWGHHPNTDYRGAIRRHELVQLQMESSLHLYPCVFEEMFCISVAESQVAGVLPVTNNAGALPTTNMGRMLYGNPSDPTWVETFVKNVVELLNDPDLDKKQDWVRSVAMSRFSTETIVAKWDKEVFSRG